MKRRNFLKMMAGIPMVFVVPVIAFKEQDFHTITIGSSNVSMLMAKNRMKISGTVTGRYTHKPSMQQRFLQDDDTTQLHGMTKHSIHIDELSFWESGTTNSGVSMRAIQKA